MGMHQADFTKMSAADDGVTEYIIDNSHSDTSGCVACCRSPRSKRHKHHVDGGFCCSPCCYRQNCVMMNGVFLCFAIIICVSVLVGLCVTSGRPHLQTFFFVQGECTTQRANLTGTDEKCSCGGRFCHATFPCLEIVVAYRGEDGEMIQSILHEDEHVYTNKPLCSYQPAKCIQSQNAWYVDYYRSQWGTPGQTFPCHHHPTHPGAIRHRTEPISFTVHMIFWPTLCSIVSLILCIIVYCHCCPRCYID